MIIESHSTPAVKVEVSPKSKALGDRNTKLCKSNLTVTRWRPPVRVANDIDDDCHSDIRISIVSS